jgi:NADH-quinone oxidoreductase subunit J
MTILFLILAILAIMGASAAMAFRSAVHAVLALALAFVGLALLYLSLDAQFVGFTQVIVYVGAVAILAVFAIMMTRSDSAHHHLPVFSKTWLTGVVLAGGVFTVLAWAVLTDHSQQASADAAAPVTTVTQIGEALMQRYAFPLEIMGLLLTAALVGAVVLAMPLITSKSEAKGDAQ